jgi:hypothetical protein
MFEEAMLNLLQQASVSGLPNLFVEGFNFDGSIAAGRIHATALHALLQQSHAERAHLRQHAAGTFPTEL